MTSPQLDQMLEDLFRKQQSGPSHPQRLLAVSICLATAATIAVSTLSAATPMEVGFIEARTYGANGDDLVDDTVALQAAINAGLEQDKPVFLASGTYVVSDTLWGKVQGANGCGGTTAKPLQLVGSAVGARPVIKLSAAAESGFNVANPGDGQLKAVLHIWSDNTVGVDDPLYNPSQDQESCLYRAGIRGVDFDLSGEHPSAVAIRFPAAQLSFIQDVRIVAHGAFAGIVGLPGRNSANVNLEIVGGRHGIYSKGLGLGSVLSGIRLLEQTDAALILGIYRGVAITGLEIVSDAGVAPIRMQNVGNVYAGNLTITDARIELAEGTGAAIDNSAGRFLSLCNAYVYGAQTLVSGIAAEDELTTDADGWVRVVDYAYTPATINGVAATNSIGGLRNRATIAVVEPVVEAASDIVARHVWSSTPSFEDADCYVITGPQGASIDDTAILQAAIDAHAKVYLGSGDYNISAPLGLRANTILMGTPGYRSMLKPTSAFINAYPSPSRGWIVDTDNDALATTTLMDLTIFGIGSTTGAKASGLGALRWRAGQGLVRSVNTYTSPRYYESHRHILEIIGEGGGRIYSHQDDHAIFENTSGNSPHNPEFRKVLIQGTHNPLTFYGLNIERGGDFDSGQEQGPLCEIRASSNVRVFGTKSETAGVVYKIVDSDNVLLHSIHANNNTADESWPMELIQVQNSTDLDFRNLYWPGSATRRVVADDFGGEPVYRTSFLGVYRQSSFAEPLVQIVSPASGASGPAFPTTVSATATASGSGAILAVTADVDGEDLGFDFDAPYEFTWLPTAAGVYALTADGIDMRGNVGSSPTIQVTVTNDVPEITTSSVPTAIVGVPYAIPLQSQGGDGVPVWSCLAGDLPDGFTLSEGGILAGTAQAIGRVGFTVGLVDSDLIATSDDDIQALSISMWKRGDVDGDGDVDRSDVSLITAARNRPASGPYDPRDLDRDGVITVLDARICALLFSPAPPVAPDGLAAVAPSRDRADVSWADNSDNESSFTLQRRLGFWDAWLTVQSPAANTANWTDLGLSAETGYEYRIRAEGVGGSSPWSAVATVVTPPPPPVGLGAAVFGQSVVLTWADTSLTELEFIMHRRLAGGAWSQLVRLSANTTSYTDSAVSMGNTYEYRVSAVGVGGRSDWSDSVSVTVGVAVDPNLLTNGGFENLLGTEWSGQAASNFTRVEGVARTGSWSVRAVGPSPAGFSDFGQSIPVTAGSSVKISGWLRVDSVSGGNGFALRYQFLNATGGQVTQVFLGQTTSTAGAFVEKTATVVVPAGATTLRVAAAIRSATGTAYFDDLSVVTVP